jgi:carbonic anhydrase
LDWLLQQLNARNEIIGLPPGEVCAHRNVAVQVTHVRALEASLRIKS